MGHSSDRERFPCSWESCSKSFLNEGNVQRHIQGFHKGEKLTCPHCGKEHSIVSLDLFKRHIKKHLGQPEERRFKCIEGCMAEFLSRAGLQSHTLHHHMRIGVECNIDGCGVRYATFAGFREHCKVEHEGTEVAYNARAKKAANARRHIAAKRAKAIRGLCTVYLNCANEAVVDAGGMVPACEEHHERYLKMKATQGRYALSKAKRTGWGVDVGNPDEMTVCLSAVPVPSAVVQLARYIESANRLGRVYCSDTEFATVPIKAGKNRKLIPVELAVYDLDGEVVIDTPIKYDQSVEELLADAPRTGPTTRFSWGVMQRIYGEGPQTRGMKIDDIRDILLDAGMNANSDLVKWSINGIDRQILGTIMGENIPANSICLVNHWKRVLPGFLTMGLSYFHQFLCPNSTLHQRAHRAGPDTLMLIDTTKALIDLSNRDGDLVQSTLDHSSQNYKETLHIQEQLRKECGVDEDYDVQSENETDLLNIRVPEKRAVKEMTDEDRELLALFQKSRQIPEPVNEATGMPGAKMAYEMADGNDQDTLEYLQIFASVKDEAESESDDEGPEGGEAGDDSGGDTGDE